MKKNFIKAVSALTAFCLTFGAAAFAAPITSGGSGTDYGYYWRQDFNDLPESGITAARVSNAKVERYEVAEGNYGLQITGTSANVNTSGLVIIDNFASGNVDKPLPKFDFSKGPIVLSYDVIIPAGSNLNKTTTYLNIRSNGLPSATSPGTVDLLRAARFENGRIRGCEQTSGDVVIQADKLSYTQSQTTYTAGNTYTVQTAFAYDETTKVITAKEYVNGYPLREKDSGRVLEYQFKYSDETKMDAIVSSDMFLRFSIGSGSSVVLDNITLRSEGEIDMPGDSYIGAASSSTSTNAGVNFIDTASYNLESVPPYQKAINNIPLNQTLDGDNNYYTLTKYTADNPLLLKKGTPAQSKVVWKGNPGMTVGGLDIASNSEFYILKLKSPSAVTSFAGAEPENMYTCLRRAALGIGTIAARETEILDENGGVVTLDENGTLPMNAKTIKFVTSKSAELAADKVKMVGTDGKEFTGVQSTTEPSVWTITMDALTAGTEYTITLGDFSQTVATPGAARAFYWYEGFDSYDGNTLPKGFSTASQYITFDKAEVNGSPALKYVNTYEPTASGTARYSITGSEALDFSKGALLLSYDVTPQSNLAWISGLSNILIPLFRIGGKDVSQLSIIEYGGIKAAYKTTSSWGRSAYLSEWPNASLVSGRTVTFQLLLEKSGNQIKATQYLNGKPVYYTLSGETKLASMVVDITDEDISNGWTIVIDGRRFPEGLVFDNFHITTVDGVTADDEITIGGGDVTAQINLKNTLHFADNAPEIVKEIKMQNNAAASDFIIKKYNSTTDPLLLNGETVSGYELNNLGDAMVFSKLPVRSGDEIFAIELSDGSKIQTLNGRMIDTTIFKASSSPSGLKKTRLLDADGDEVAVENGVVSPAISKMELMFTKNTELAAVPAITADGYSLTAKMGADGVYTFDFADAMLAPNTTYTVTYGDTTAGFTTGDGAVVATTPVIDADGRASCTVANTTGNAINIYLISAYFDGEGEQISNVKYEKFVVDAGTTDTIAMTETHSTLSAWSEQRVFVWNGFQSMTPYCAYGSRTNQ